MKTNFWKFAAAFVVGLAAVVACDKPEPEPVVVEPIFPETVLEENVEAGATVEVSFEANLDWELSIPAAEQNKYWLDDAGVPASKVSGKAGAQTVSVVFSEDVYYDTNVLCEVTLTMGGKSQVIAKLTRLAINRTLTVFVAEENEWGGYKNSYTTTAATALAFKEFRGYSEYTLPVQVVANYDWNLVLPAWCKGEIKVAAGETAPETLSGQAGKVVEVVLTAVLSNDVKAGAADKVKFLDATATDQAVELELTLPAFENRVEWDGADAFNLDDKGASTLPAMGYVLAMDGFVVRALEYDGTFHGLEYASWVTANVVSEAEATEALLKNTAIQFSVSENTGKERCADLFIFPASLKGITPDLLCVSDETCSIKDEYKKYHIGRLTQAGAPQPFIVPVEAPDFLEYEGVFFTDLEPKGSDNIMQWDIEGAQSYHKITYTKQWAYESAMFSINKPFATCKFYEDTQYPEGFFTKEVTPDWIEFWANPDKTMGKFNMLYTPSSPIHIAAVFFDADGNKVAAVLVEYNPAGGGSSSAALELSLMDGQATISTLPETSELYQILSSNLGVPTVFEVNAAGTAMFTLSQPFSMASVFDMTLNTTSVVMAECFDQYGLAVGSEADNAEVIIVLKNEMWVNVAAIHYTYSKGGSTGGSTSTVNPAEFFDFENMSGNPVITAMDPSSELYQMLAGNVGCTNLMVVNANTNIVLTGTAAHPFITMEIYNLDMTPASTPMTMVQPIEGGMAMIMVQTITSGTERLLVFKNSANEIVSICHYIYTV